MALKNRFELRMDDKMASDLEQLSEKCGVNQATVLRKALALYAEVKKDDKSQVIIRNKNTEESVTLVVI